MPRQNLTIALRNMRIGRCVAMTVAAVALMSPLAGCSSSSPATGSTPAANATHKHHIPQVNGKITAESGTSWTVQGDNGTTYTVTVNDQTRYGSKKTPATKDEFKIGNHVRIAGPISGTTVTATDIRNSSAKATAPTS